MGNNNQQKNPDGIEYSEEDDSREFGYDITHVNFAVKSEESGKSTSTGLMDYTPSQIEYIRSVNGQAHNSAVRIIGRLEQELLSYKKERNKCSDSTKKSTNTG